ncbi:MAG: 50S ribosomal protein L35 [Proteobacteria bacterium]|jgi:large subunit ribosomal protein L35|nr:50S ribosomal protein L35 [Pseudomonadota bacterium]NLN63189.1 50S ribosomal protein L35 [Myxococcales bacterium]
MPKMKTNRAAAKRFRKTASGKIRCDKPFHSHILTKKSSKRKRRLRKNDIVDATSTRQVRKLLPYL